MTENITSGLWRQHQADVPRWYLRWPIVAGVRPRRIGGSRKLGTKEGGNGKSQSKEGGNGKSQSKEGGNQPLPSHQKASRRDNTSHEQIRKQNQSEAPSRCARRSVRRWKGQPAKLCPVPKTCPTSWLYNRRILDFCSIVRLQTISYLRLEWRELSTMPPEDREANHHPSSLVWL